MKLFIVACLLAAAAAAPSSPDETAALRALPALVHDEFHDELGQYVLHYVTAEGTVVNERGRLDPSGNADLITEGEYLFIGDDGKTYVTKYGTGTAPDGFHAEGAHLSGYEAPVA